MILFYYYFIVLIIFNVSVQFQLISSLIGEDCQKNCQCERQVNSSKIQLAKCFVDTNDDFIKCNVEWPVLFVTIKKIRFKSLLASCKRIKRLMITKESTVIVLIPEMFQYNNQLEFLGVQAPIRTIESQFLKYLSSLKQLEISETDVEQLSKSMFQDCPVRGKIKLSSNKIYFIADRTFENCNELVKLDLSGNHLVGVNSLTFNKADKLEDLDLSRNKISNIDEFSFKHLQKLKMLNLNENLLKIIKKDTFGQMESLKHLLLDSNLIGFINDEAFSGLRQITFISLKNNFLQRLDLVLYSKKFTIIGIKCVIEQDTGYLRVSLDVRGKLESSPLCIGKQKIMEKPDNPDNKKPVQSSSISPFTQNSKPDLYTQNKNSFSFILENHPYLFPMIFGGLAVMLVSIIVIAVVCHVKNKQISELKFQEIQIPMMHSTL